ncbi:MAG: LysR family transcriptional regulator [Kiloniellales bacterium]|nr:LysR family transcriptional regulator [Kiloniellales bacterium]
MDLKTLQTIVAIADHGSFAEAGEAVGLSQSAVSLRVKALEARLGVTLFDRGNRPPSLNAEGHAFVAEARSIVESWQALLGDFVPSPRVTSLHIGAVPTSICSVLPPALRRLRESKPHLSIRLTTALSDRLEEMVLKQELDCAIVGETRKPAIGVRWHAFAREPLVVIAPSGAAAASDVELLTSAPYIRFSRHAWAGQLIEQEVVRRGIKLQPAMEVDTLDGIALLVASGLGVSVVPSRPRTNPFPDSIQAVPFGRPPIHRVLGLIERADNERADLTRVMVLALSAVAAEIYEP